MAGTTGPTKTLPGSLHPVPPGATCDIHPDRLAIARVQGETDSAGAELIDCCAECAPVAQAAATATSGTVACDQCGQFADKLQNYRDPDEGAMGRLYQLCDSCAASALGSDQTSTGIANDSEDEAESEEVDESDDEQSDENVPEVDTDDHPDFLPGEQPTDFADLDHIGPFDPPPRRR